MRWTSLGTPFSGTLKSQQINSASFRMRRACTSAIATAEKVAGGRGFQGYGKQKVEGKLGFDPRSGAQDPRSESSSGAEQSLGSKGSFYKDMGVRVP